MSEPSETCELCSSLGGEPIWESTLCRVVRVADPDYPGFCRVILNRHEQEMSDLTEVERHQIMQVVFAVEDSLRRLINPHKINLASLGNMTPHVHWHIIPRWRDDRCFPNPIWASAQRTGASVRSVVDVARLKDALTALLGKSTTTSNGWLP